MAFNGTEGEMITLAEAAGMTENYRGKNPGDVRAIFYGKDEIQSLLSQTGALGIRIYFGEDEDGNKQLVLVAADANENDIIGLILDNGIPCPTSCSTSNPLNGLTR